MKRRSCGFTLIELVLVVAILAMCGLFSSQYGYLMLQRLTLSHTVKQLRYFLVSYQQQAMWVNAHYLLTLKRVGANWHLTLLHVNPLFEDRMKNPIACFIRPTSLMNIELNSAGVGLFLNGQRGTSSAGHIIVANASGQYKVIISSLGRIRVQRCSGSTC